MGYGRGGGGIAVSLRLECLIQKLISSLTMGMKDRGLSQNPGEDGDVTTLPSLAVTGS